MKKIIVVLFLVLGFIIDGCAGTPVRTDRLQVSISPEKLYPGCIVSVFVKAPAGTKNVTGRLDILGSPVVPLRSKDGGRTWFFITQIPLDAVWQPGRYRAIVQGRAPDGTDLFGEAWVTAP